MTSISNRHPEVGIEYTDGRTGERVTKVFTDAYKARRFYLAKLKARREPKVTKVQ